MAHATWPPLVRVPFYFTKLLPTSILYIYILLICMLKNILISGGVVHALLICTDDIHVFICMLKNILIRGGSRKQTCVSKPKQQN